MPPTYLEFVNLPEYLRATKGILSEADHERIEHYATRGVVYLISFYAKSARSDITSAERTAFRRLVKQLEGVL